MLDIINNKLDIINIESLHYYNDLKNHPNKWKEEILRILIKKNEEDISKIDDDIKKNNSEIYSINNHINYINSQISKKIYVIGNLAYPGPLKQKLDDEICELKSNKEGLEHDLLDLYSKIESLRSDRNEFYTKRSEIIKKFENDLKKLNELEKDSDFSNKMKGAWGENQVVESIKESFRGKKNFHLINAFDINVIGEAINFKDKMCVVNKIDHILLCPKGLFVLETKTWREYNQTGIDKIVDQLERSKTIMHKIFDTDIKDLSKFVLISTTKDVELKPELGFDSVRLDRFKDFINKQPDVINGGDINIILGKLLPHFDENQLSDKSKTFIKLKSVFSKTERLIRTRIRGQNNT